jgi:patched domain-containing protein
MGKEPASVRKFDCLEQPLSQLFYRYGQFVAKHPLPLIFFPVFVTIFSLIGFISLDSITDAIYLFTPVNAQSKMERQVIHDLWPLVNGSYIPGRAVTQSREVQVAHPILQSI